MLRNYVKIAFRGLVRNKVYSAINIIGLAIGLAVCMLIMVYVVHESSYDTFHKEVKNINWIQGKVKMGTDSVFLPMMSYSTGPIMQQREPAVQSYLRLKRDNSTPVISLPAHTDLKFTEEKFMFADSNFFSFFSFPLLSGQEAHVLDRPFSTVISYRAAQKYFGNADPVGKVLRYNDQYDLTITGVARNAPSNSSIDFDLVVALSSLHAMPAYKGFVQEGMVQLGAFTTYFRVHQPAQNNKLAASLKAAHLSAGGENNESYMVTPLTNTHVNANYSDASHLKYMKLFPIVAALILLLALANYMSLSTARASIRAKEIGVRKVLGAGRVVIARQFFVESALYSILAFAAGLLLCIALKPTFFQFLQLDIDQQFFLQPTLLLSFGALLVLTILLSGTYPSILLSAYKPVQVLYGKFSKQSGGVNVRRFFTVFQFSISVILIICSLVIDRQMYFFRHKDTGVTKENMVMVPFSRNVGDHHDAFKKEMAALPGIQQVTSAWYPMYKGYNMNFVNTPNSTAQSFLPIFNIDEDFLQVMGLQWVQPPADPYYFRKKHTIIINEKSIAKLGLNRQPIGQKINMMNQDYEIAGVVKDFNYESLHREIGALALVLQTDSTGKSNWQQQDGCLMAKTTPGANIPTLVQQMRTIYNRYDPVNPFNYMFMDESFDALYKAEDRLARIFSVFTILTIIIACLGLFGLATFMAEQRTKEIGIRKVLGASVAGIVTMMSKDFVKLVLIAVVIASPIAWYVMHKWLQEFAYRTNISAWIFIVAAMSAVLVALITISFRSVKAAITNPIKSLRSE